MDDPTKTAQPETETQSQTQQQAAAVQAPADESGENKFRRLFEKEQRERTKLEGELKKRQEAELTEGERLKRQAEEAGAELATLRAENLRIRIAQETGLTGDALEFLHGADEEALRAQAIKLVAMVKRSPVQAGTVTDPGGSHAPSLDDQIADAERSGKRAECIRLKTIKMRGG